jgi:hypothetical protein
VVSALSTSSLPAINGNNLFWVMAALILAEAVAIVKLAGAVHRGRQLPVPAQNSLPGAGFASPGFGEPDPPARPVRRGRGGRLLGALVLVAGVLFVADKVMHFKAPSSAAGPAATPAPTAAPKVTVKPPSPSPSASHSVAAPVTHAASHFPLTGTEIVIIAIVLICAAAGYLITRVRAREL